MVLTGSNCLICLHHKHDTDSCFSKDQQNTLCGLDGCDKRHNPSVHMAPQAVIQACNNSLHKFEIPARGYCPLRRIITVTCPFQKKLTVTCPFRKKLTITCPFRKKLTVTCPFRKKLTVTCPFRRKLTVTCENRQIQTSNKQFRYMMKI